MPWELSDEELEWYLEKSAQRLFFPHVRAAFPSFD
jgi:hypothetical protein